MAHLAVSEERQRIALDLHDTVGAALFAMTAAVRSLAQEPDLNDRLKARISVLEQQTSDVAALRDSLRAIRATAGEVMTEAALRDQCQSFERRTGIGTRLIVFGPIPELSGTLVSVLIYAAREGLLNVEKHAQATAVAVTLASLRKGVAVTVNDDGKALVENDVPLTYGFGLTAVAEALSRVGGKLSLTRNADGGVSLRGWIPC
jgi:signal transduction histidine kinase